MNKKKMLYVIINQAIDNLGGIESNGLSFQQSFVSDLDLLETFNVISEQKREELINKSFLLSRLVQKPIDTNNLSANLLKINQTKESIMQKCMKELISLQDKL